MDATRFVIGPLVARATVFATGTLPFAMAPCRAFLAYAMNPGQRRALRQNHSWSGPGPPVVQRARDDLDSNLQRGNRKGNKASREVRARSAAHLENRDAQGLDAREGELQIELKGNLAAMLGAGQNAKRSPETGDLSLQIAMVAGRANPLNLEFSWSAA